MEPKKIQMINIQTGKVIEFPDNSLRPKFDYPSEWFLKNNSKPVLVLPKLLEDLPSLQRSIYKHYKDGNEFPLVLTLALLDNVMRNLLKGTCPVKWDSFGQHIADAGVVVRALDLMAVSRTSETIPLCDASGGHLEPIKGILLHILGYYRLKHIDRIDYKQQVLRTINARIRAANSSMIIKDGGISGISHSWRSDRQFAAAVACIDMFLVRFPDHPLADLRFLTSEARYKHCGAVSDLHHLMECSQLTSVEISGWLWFHILIYDFERINHPGQEIEEKHSYMPYMYEMNMSTDSPYTVKINFSFHFFAHVVGATLGSTRSERSRVVGTRNFSTFMIDNVKIAAFALSCNNESASQDSERQGVGEFTTPTTRNQNDWRRLFLRRFKFGDTRTFPQDMTEHLHSIWKKFTNARDGSFGKYLSDLAQRQD